MPLVMMAAGGSPAGGRSRTLLFPWRRRSRLAAAAGADADVANDPSGATVVPKPFPPIEPAPQGPNPKAIFALVVGEVLLGCLAFPLGYVFKVSQCSSNRPHSLSPFWIRGRRRGGRGGGRGWRGGRGRGRCIGHVYREWFFSTVSTPLSAALTSNPAYP